MCIFKRSKTMLKYLPIIVIISAFMSLPAEALVKQDVSKALSYRNVVSGASSSTSSLKSSEMFNQADNSDKTSDQKTEQIVDLRKSASKSIAVKQDEEFGVKVEEKDGYVWRVSYDTEAIIMVGNSIKEDAREIKFIQSGDENNEIYLDRIDSSGKVVQNKAIYIKVY